MNQEYLIFIVCTISMCYNIVFISRPNTITNDSSKAMWTRAKQAALIITQLFAFSMTAVFLMQWEVAYSSIVAGILMLSLASTYTWGYVHEERATDHGGHGTPTIDYSLDTHTVCSPHTTTNKNNKPICVHIHTSMHTHMIT